VVCIGIFVDCGGHLENIWWAHVPLCPKLWRVVTLWRKLGMRLAGIVAGNTLRYTMVYNWCTTGVQLVYNWFKTGLKLGGHGG
jgi:hypothetical protein